MTGLESIKKNDVKIENDFVKHGDIEATNKDVKSFDFEHALRLTGVSRYNYLLFTISLYSLLAAAVELFSGAIIGTLTQCDLELDNYRKGILRAVPMLGVMTSAHLWGYIADTRGRKYTLIITTCGTFIIAFISAFANHWILMVVMKYFSAVCASGTNAVVYALLGESTPQRVRSNFLLLCSSGLMTSSIVITVLSYPILLLSFNYPIEWLGFAYRPWRLLVQANGFVSGVNALLLLFFVFESPKFYFSKGNHEEGLNVLRQIFRINTGKNIEEYSVKRVILKEDVQTAHRSNIFKSVWDQTAPLFKKKYIKNTLLICYLSILSFSLGPAFIMWLPTIFNIYNRASNGTIQKNFCEMIQPGIGYRPEASECNDSIEDLTFIAMSAVALALCAANMAGTVLANYYGKRILVILIHGISAVSAIALSHIYNIGGTVAFSLSWFNCICMGVTTAYTVELFPTYLRAMSVCLTIMIGRGFSSIIINIVGTQLEYNCTNFFYGMAGFLLTGVIVGYFLPADKQNKSNCDNEDET